MKNNVNFQQELDQAIERTAHMSGDEFIRQFQKANERPAFYGRLSPSQQVIYDDVEKQVDGIIAEFEAGAANRPTFTIEA